MGLKTWRFRSGRGRVVLAGAAVLAAGAVVLAGPAAADYAQPPPPLPVFAPGPTDWSPNFETWPYNTFTYQVTPQMISGMADSCQWFNAQFDPLMGQINDFNRHLGEQHDDFAAAGVQSHADAVVANIGQSTAFLAPRLQPLTITNTPDNFGPYSPIFGGEYLTKTTFQLSRIAENIRQQNPSGVAHANIVHATGWGNALRDSGACT